MYLHLGQDVVVRLGDVVGIFDLENTTLEKESKVFLAKATKENRVVNVSDEMPKTFIVCRPPNGVRLEEIVYISQISAQTLRKRAGFIEHLDGNVLDKMQ